MHAAPSLPVVAPVSAAGSLLEHRRTHSMPLGVPSYETPFPQHPSPQEREPVQASPPPPVAQAQPGPAFPLPQASAETGMHRSYSQPSIVPATMRSRAWGYETFAPPVAPPLLSSPVPPIAQASGQSVEGSSPSPPAALSPPGPHLLTHSQSAASFLRAGAVPPFQPATTLPPQPFTPQPYTPQPYTHQSFTPHAQQPFTPPSAGMSVGSFAAPRPSSFVKYDRPHPVCAFTVSGRLLTCFPTSRSSFQQMPGYGTDSMPGPLKAPRAAGWSRTCLTAPSLAGSRGA